MALLKTEDSRKIKRKEAKQCKIARLRTHQELRKYGCKIIKQQQTKKPQKLKIKLL